MDELLAYTGSGLLFIGYLVFAWKWPGWGLGLLPFSIAAFAMCGIMMADAVVLGLGAFLFPAAIGVVRWAPAGSALETPWYRSVSAAIILVGQYILLLAILTLVFNVFGPLLFVLFGVAIVRYKRAHKYSVAMDILSAVGLSMRQSLPLPMAMATAANGQRGKAARIFTAMASWLTKGYSLSESLKRAYRKCPAELAASIAAAEELGQLPETIQTLEQDISEKITDARRDRPVQIWYPITVAFVAFFIITGLAYFIIPTFAEVLSDMSDGRASLPWMTQVILDASLWLKGHGGFNLLVVLAVILIPMMILLSPNSRRHRRKGPSPVACFSDWVKWHLPIVRWFESSYAQLQLIEILKVGMRAGYPVNQTVRQSLILDMNLCYRRKIRGWLEAIEQGQNISASARQAGIGQTLAWAMDDSLNKENLPVILESMEEISRSQYHYRLNMVQSVLCPVVVIAMGCGVGFVVTAIFLPMARMIPVLM